MLLAGCLATSPPPLLAVCLAPPPPCQEDFAARLENRPVSQPNHNSLANRQAEAEIQDR